MASLKMKAGELLGVVEALDAVFPIGVKLPIGLSVEVGELRVAVYKYHAEIMSRVGPVIEKHTDGGSSIGPDHENHPAFVKEAAPFFAEAVEVRLEPIPLSALAAVEGLEADPDFVVVLVKFGLIYRDGPKAGE